MRSLQTFKGQTRWPEDKKMENVMAYFKKCRIIKSKNQRVAKGKCPWKKKLLMEIVEQTAAICKTKKMSISQDGFAMHK